MYEAKDVKVEWHVPSSEELEFVFELLDRVVVPGMDVLDSLLEGPREHWDNDFCR